MQLRIKSRQLGNRQRFQIGIALRQIAAQAVAALAQIAHFFAVFREAVIRQIAAFDLLVGNRNVEAGAEFFQRILIHFFGLVGGVLAFAGSTHAIAFDGFGQNHGGAAARVVYRFIIGGIHFVRVVAAAVERPNFCIRHIGHHGFQARSVEEMIAHISAVFRFIGLIIAVEAFIHTRFELVVGIARQECIPAATPNHFEHIPTGTAEVAFQFLNNLAVAAHRAVEALQVAVDYKNQVVQAFAGSQRNRALAFRLVHLAITAEHPHFAAFGFGEAARFQIFQETGLINRHQRTQAHRHGGELPKIGHQVRVRIRREAFALDFLAEIIQLIFAQAAFHESAGINTGRGVALDKHQIALGIIVFGVPKMVEAHVIQGGGRLERSDVAAQLQIFFAGAQHHSGGIPADNGADAVFQFLIARRFLLFAHRNGVQISGGGIKR